MARPERTRKPDLTYHIYSRCIELRRLMTSAALKELMIQVLVNTQKKYTFELIAYEIMDNHFHFVIRTLPGEADISRIIQYIKARFAESYNRRNNRTGPFWNERFCDQIIEYAEKPVQYLLWLLWYLAFNPVRKGMVRNPRDSRFGSINAYLNEAYQGKIKITLHRYFLDLGSTFKQQVKEFLWYEEAYRRRLAVYF